MAPIAALADLRNHAFGSEATKIRLFDRRQDVTATHPFRVLFDERTFATVSRVLGRAATEPLDVSVTLSRSGTQVGATSFWNA